MADYLAFAQCFSGPGTPHAAGCADTDFDHDGDTDLADLLAFQGAFTGAR